jgi:hypothetical protein
LRNDAEAAKVSFLFVGEALAVLAEDGFDARVDFGLAFGGELWEVCGLLWWRNRCVA